MIKHSPECQAAMTARTNETVAYLRAWPDHCRRCHGWGGFHSTYDPSPAGVSLGHGTMEDFDTCPDCFDLGLCPRCGAMLDDGTSALAAVPALRMVQSSTSCAFCGWDEETDGCPEPAECSCWTNDGGGLDDE